MLNLDSPLRAKAIAVIVVSCVVTLASPLLARMPGRIERPGHYRRDVPEGIMWAHRNGPDVIKDPTIREYYRKMSLVTESERLFTLERWREILLLNTVDRRLQGGRRNAKTAISLSDH